MEKLKNAKVQVWPCGFKYTLPNGYTLSMAFGPGNYCDNKDKPLFEDKSWNESSNFEVAVFEPNGDIVDLVRSDDDEWTDQVIGYVPAAALPMLISALKFWPVRPRFTGEEHYIPSDVAAARRLSAEEFEKTLRARCRIFRNVCEDYQKKAKKEAEASNSL